MEEEQEECVPSYSSKKQQVAAELRKLID